MELLGESAIAASRETVWRALNDPEVLARCIDGVESLVRVGDDRFEGKLNAKVGPVRATFSGGLNLTEIDAPNRYVLVGEGKGGVAGFAKGNAEVTLSEIAGSSATLLRYHVTSSVGGKLAQLGARLIEGTAKAYAETFFSRFKEIVEDQKSEKMSERNEGVVSSATLEPLTSRNGLKPLTWGILLLFVVVALLMWQLA